MSACSILFLFCLWVLLFLTVAPHWFCQNHNEWGLDVATTIRHINYQRFALQLDAVASVWQIKTYYLAIVINWGFHRVHFHFSIIICRWYIYEYVIAVNVAAVRISILKIRLGPAQYTAELHLGLLIGWFVRYNVLSAEPIAKR